MTTEDESTQAERPTRWVTFQLDGETYAVNVLNVHEVLKNAEITPVPGAPEAVLGIINLRGNVVTVIDGRRRFSLKPIAATDATRIIIAEVDGQMLGLMVDSVAEVIDLTSDEISVSPAISSDDTAVHIHGVVSRDSGLVILLNLDNLTDTIRLR